MIKKFAASFLTGFAALLIATPALSQGQPQYNELKPPQPTETDGKKNGITDGVVTLGSPRHVDIMGDRAYVVVPANYTFKQKGKPGKEIGSTLTVALQKGPTGWRMTRTRLAPLPATL